MDLEVVDGTKKKGAVGGVEGEVEKRTMRQDRTALIVSWTCENDGHERL